MNLIDNRTRAIGEMALNGLEQRARAISANTVNVLTPNYQRKEVSFEESLRGVIARENEKEEMKLQNSRMFQQNPQELLKSQTPAQIAFLNSQYNDGFSISVETDLTEADGMDGNNVNLEAEMMDEAKNGMQYQVVASLLSKSYAMMNTIIKGQNQ